MRRMCTKMLGRASLSLLAGAAMALAVGRARANVAAPRNYEVRVSRGSAVQICFGFGGWLCSPGMKSPLVRKNMATGQMVVIPEHCDEKKCFIDECVPPGTYQWGLAEPEACVGTSSVSYEGHGTVSEPLADTCVPRVGPERPTPYTGKLPWTANNIACRGGYCSACAVGRETGAEIMLGANGAAIAVALGLFLRRRHRARARRG